MKSLERVRWAIPGVINQACQSQRGLVSYRPPAVQADEMNQQTHGFRSRRHHADEEFHAISDRHMNNAGYGLWLYKLHWDLQIPL